MAQASTTVGKDQRLYARKSSGLVRTIGVFGAMVFGVHCISLSSSGLIPFSWVAGVWPGSSIIGVLTVAMFFCLFHAYTYSVIGATMPRSAADYTLGSRTLSAPAGIRCQLDAGHLHCHGGRVLDRLDPEDRPANPVPHDGDRLQQPGMLAFADWSVTTIGIIVIGTIGSLDHLWDDDPADTHDRADPGSRILPGPDCLGSDLLPAHHGWGRRLPGSVG